MLYKLSYRDLVEMMAERGLSMAHTTIMRWVVRFIPNQLQDLSEKGQDRRSATVHTVSFMTLRCCSAVFASRSSLHRLGVIPIDSAGIKEKAN